MTRSKLCGDCRTAWMRWLDYRLQERAEARFREWRDTVRFQQGLIEEQCAAGRHGPTAGSSPSVSPSSSPRSSSGQPPRYTTIDLPAT